MTRIEEEVVLLKAIKELIDSMVNFELLEILGSDPDSQVMFKSMTHQKFFNIVLVDFLSRTDKKAGIQQTSYLGALESISNAPSFDICGSGALLAKSTRECIDWLGQEVEVKTWFPSIHKATVLKISRVSFLKMCGNISKHNFLRSVGVAVELKDTLQEAGIVMPLEDALLALADFYERFHADILNYHASTIAEFLNTIRWGIYEYLQPEFQRSIVWESREPPKHRYTHPNGVTTRFAQECYWELMNEVQSAAFRPPLSGNTMVEIKVLTYNMSRWPTGKDRPRCWHLGVHCLGASATGELGRQFVPSLIGLESRHLPFSFYEFVKRSLDGHGKVAALGITQARPDDTAIEIRELADDA